MRVYLSLGFKNFESGGLEKGPVFGPWDSVSFLWDRVKIDCDGSKRVNFCFDNEGCVRYNCKKYNDFLVFSENKLDEFWERLVKYDKRFNWS